MTAANVQYVAKKPEENRKIWEFDDNSIDSLKTYYKIDDSDDGHLYDFIRKQRAISDEE